MAARQLDEYSALTHASIGGIIGLGLLYGIIHVLTGPDHLSALVALSSGSSWRSFFLGIRWGCGHSTGLIIITIIFFALSQTLDVDTLGSYFDFIVGILMIFLGLWGLYHYIKQRKKAKEEGLEALEINNPHDAFHPPVHPANDSELPRTENKQDSIQKIDTPKERTSLANYSQLEEGYSELNQDETKKRENDRICCNLCYRPTRDFKNPTTQKITSFVYGLFHGTAGTGGILGVLPAVVLDDWGKSIAYICSFCVSSILIMGIFAALYGEITGRITHLNLSMYYKIGIFSSCLSLIVGITWVTLVSMGELDAVFG